MKPTLQLKLSQHLTLTPQLQQSIRLLQLSTLELNAEVERLLQENPLLEKAEDEESAGPPREFTTMVSTPATDKPGDGATSSSGSSETKTSDSESKSDSKDSTSPGQVNSEN